MSNQKLLTVVELSEKLQCSKSTIYRMINDELIPYYNIRGGYRFDLREVLEALKQK
jgi:excisionase family DNA binding protein